MIEALIFALAVVQAGTIVYLIVDHNEGIAQGEDLVRAVRRGAVPPTAEEYEEAAWARIGTELDAARRADRERLLVRRMEERLRAEGERTARDG